MLKFFLTVPVLSTVTLLRNAIDPSTLFMFKSSIFHTLSPEAEFLDVIGTKIIRVLLLADGYYSPVPLRKSDLKLVDNVNRIREPQVWELSRLCSETSTKLCIHEFGFWTEVRDSGWGNSPLVDDGFCTCFFLVYCGRMVPWGRSWPVRHGQLIQCTPLPSQNIRREVREYTHEKMKTCSAEPVGGDVWFI